MKKSAETMNSLYVLNISGKPRLCCSNVCRNLSSCLYFCWSSANCAAALMKVINYTCASHAYDTLKHLLTEGVFTHTKRSVSTLMGYIYIYIYIFFLNNQWWPEVPSFISTTLRL